MKHCFKFELDSADAETFLSLFDHEEQKLLVMIRKEFAKKEACSQKIIDYYEARIEYIKGLKKEVTKDLLSIDKQENITRVYSNER